MSNYCQLEYLCKLQKEKKRKIYLTVIIYISDQLLRLRTTLNENNKKFFNMRNKTNFLFT